MIKQYLFFVLSFLIFFGCDSSDDITSPGIPAHPVAVADDLNLAGNFTVVVTKNSNGQVQTFYDEVITQTGLNSYYTSTTAFYNSVTLPEPPSHGFTFTTDLESIQVPVQNLCNYYTNEVQGLYNAPVDGIIIDADHFTINYEITHTIQVPYYTYTAEYTRN